jgi:hypothetical protein
LCKRRGMIFSAKTVWLERDLATRTCGWDWWIAMALNFHSIELKSYEQNLFCHSTFKLRQIHFNVYIYILGHRICVCSFLGQVVGCFIFRFTLFLDTSIFHVFHHPTLNQNRRNQCRKVGTRADFWIRLIWLLFPSKASQIIVFSEFIE